jgi:archaellum biogenesis ATPase FlaH
MRIETSIINNLLVDEEYARKVVPFTSTDYFLDRSEKAIVKEITEFFVKYNTLPSVEAIKIQLNSTTGITDTELKTAVETLDSLDLSPAPSKDWLIEKTEKFFKDRSVYNAVLQSIKIIEGKDGKLSQDAIPSLLQQALAVSFDTEIGHSYMDDAASRYDFYTRKDERIPFDLELLDKVTTGGLPRKSLAMVVAESGGGKSLFLCHATASYIRQGKNVLYITMEMAEERIAERIDANLLNVDIGKIEALGKDEFISKIEKINAKSHGKLVIKEYPTGAAHSGHFRGLIEELKTKKNFVPDVLVVDYLGICASSRLKHGSNVNTYSYIKSISEELRALGVEYNVPVLTAMQVNRGGFGNSELELTDVSESIGVVMTCDFVFSIIRTEELDELNQTLIKILKNRYADLNFHRKFVVGINRSRMKLYDLEGNAQSGLSGNTKYEPRTKEPDVPLFDRSSRRNLDMSGLIT